MSQPSEARTALNRLFMRAAIEAACTRLSPWRIAAEQVAHTLIVRAAKEKGPRLIGLLPDPFPNL